MGKVSCAIIIITRLAGSKICPNWITSMKMALIFASQEKYLLIIKMGGENSKPSFTGKNKLK